MKLKANALKFNLRRLQYTQSSQLVSHCPVIKYNMVITIELVRLKKKLELMHARGNPILSFIFHYYVRETHTACIWRE